MESEAVAERCTFAAGSLISHDDAPVLLRLAAVVEMTFVQNMIMSFFYVIFSTLQRQYVSAGILC